MGKDHTEIRFQRSCNVMLASGLFVAASCLHAATYYVDAAQGNDAWSGLSDVAGTGNSGPWRSLRKAGLAALQPGDVLALKCSSVWNEPLTLIRGGTANQPIQVRPYGDCAAGSMPTVDVTTLLTGWSPLPDGSFSVKPGNTVSAVFVDGKYLAPAQYPPEGLGVTGELPQALRQFSKRYLFDKALSIEGTGDLAGAKLRVRTQDYTVEERGVTGISSEGVVKLESDTDHPIRPGNYYYLVGKPWMLKRGGAWTYAQDSDELRIRMPANANPESYRVQAPRALFALQVAGAAYLNITGLRLARSVQDAVIITGSRHVKLEKIEVTDAGQDGITIKDSNEIVISDSAVLRSHRNGIVVTNSRNTSVLRNRVEDTGMIGQIHGTVAAINVDDWLGGDVIVDGNHVQRSGYSGIRFKRNAKISNNRVEQSCLTLTDCGAIYSWADNQADPPLNSEVRNNVVIGTQVDESDTPYRSFSSGIYLDDRTNGVRVIGNTVKETDSGVHVHNGYNLLVEGNVLSDNRRNQVYFSMDHSKVAPEMLANNQIRGNTLKYGPVSLGVEVVSRFPHTKHAEFDGNRYSARGSRAVAYIAERPGQETQPPLIYDFERWRSQQRQEASGKYMQSEVATMTGTVPVMTEGFRQNIAGWGVWSPDNTGALRWEANCNGASCMEITAGQKTAIVYGREASLGSGRNCMLSLKIRSPAPDAPLQVRLRRNKQPFAAAGLATQILADTSWADYRLPFRTNRYASETTQIEFKATMGRLIQIAALELSCQKK